MRKPDVDEGRDSLDRERVLRCVQEIFDAALEVLVPVEDVELFISKRLLISR
jgi:hypothetical protein